MIVNLRERVLVVVGWGLLAAGVCGAEGPESARTFGWRGNWTGLYGQADPPTQWARTLRGIVPAMTCQAAKPAPAAVAGAQDLKDGLARDWLIIGPFSVADSAADFDKEQIPNEADLAPKEGDAVGQLTWKRLEIPRKPDYERWGTTELDWLDPGEALECKANQMAYAHTYLHSPQAGKVLMVVDHGHGLKVWINGKNVYGKNDQIMNFGSYVGISRQKQDLIHVRSPKFELALDKGWNRLLVKVGTARYKGAKTCKFAARLLDPQPSYDQKNIVWMTVMPERTNAAPIIVGDRLFTPAEPDELLCLDKKTGQVLWRRFNSLYDAADQADRKASPVFQEKIAPLAEALSKTTDYEKSMELRRSIAQLLVAADPVKYKLKWDGHLAAHFGIVGFTTTPVSDGRSVFAFFGQGVVACYDLEGNRKWIRRLESNEIRYSCSPALIGGKLLCIFSGLQALDARTGEVAWKVPDVTSMASLIPATIRGVDVVITNQGRAYRVSDGRLMWANPQIHAGDTGWAAPVFQDNVLYLPWHGVGELIVADFSEVQGEQWQPKVRNITVNADHHRPNGQWLDRFTAGSPLIHEGMYYNIDQYGVFYAVDLKTGKTLYRQDVGFDELHHYNAIGVGASATLGGGNIYVVDNQGACVVLAPGPTYKQVAVNRIETVLPRDWPIPPQEILSNGPPVFDGKSMYIRGEQYLYCIGQTSPAASQGKGDR